MSVDLTAGPDGTVLARAGDAELFTYVTAPQDPELESPRPYLYPLRTLDGRNVSIHRPQDHVWHKGLSWALPNVGPDNFWGGPTYVRDQGYVQLPNTGTMRHVESLPAGPGRFVHRLRWESPGGTHVVDEVRGLAAAVGPVLGAWWLALRTTMVNAGAEPLRIGSPTTEGRPAAGYGGLFWRGPRSFTGGPVYTAGTRGGDELMGVEAPWAAVGGRHDGVDGSAVVLMAHEPGMAMPGGRRWFLRTSFFAGICAAPFFDTPVVLAPGAAATFAYRVAVLDRDPGHDGVREAAAALLAADPLLEELPAPGDGTPTPQDPASQDTVAPGPVPARDPGSTG